MVFAREINDPLTSLVKKMDEATAEHKKDHMGSFVVFLTNQQSMEKQVKDLADKEKIKNTILTILDTPSGPPGYGVAKDADFTVVLYKKHEVKANYAFRKGEFSDQDVDRIVKDFTKIVP